MNKKHFHLMALCLCYLIIFLPVTSALRIENVETSPIRQREATVTFQTDEVATATVEYGRNLNLGITATTQAGIIHQANLDGLESETRYFYQIKAETPSGDTIINNNNGNYFMFETPPPIDTTAPIISNISLSGFTTTSTIINWATDDEATSTVWYGEETYESVTEAGLRSRHQINVQTAQNKKYKLIVQSCNADDYCANSSVSTFTAGPNQQAPDLDFSVPKKVPENRVTITGKTTASASVTVRVNGNEVRRSNADDKGDITLRNVPLSKLSNTVEIRVKDLAGKESIKTYEVGIDAGPPRLFIEGFTPVSRTGSMNLIGKLNEPANVSIFINLQDDTKAPIRVTNVKVDDISSNGIGLTWDANPEKDIREYAVFRGGELIGTSTINKYIDTGAPLGEVVGYRVSAIDNSCNQGTKSSEFEVRVPSQGIQRTAPSASLECDKAADKFYATGDFTKQVNLREGVNDVTIIAEDEAGNKAIFTNQTIFDRSPPQVEHNLNAVSPTYIPEVTISGKASERVSILIYVNDETKPSITEVTSESGAFEIDVPLSQGKVITSKKDIPQGIEPGQGILHNIRLEAIDIAGNKYTSKKTDIIHAYCGFGSTFTVDIQEPKPDMLNPHLILEGFGQVGFNLNISYNDLTDFNWRGKPAVYLRPLSREEGSLFDRDVLITPRWNLNPNGGQGYVQLNMETPSFPREATRIDKLNNISKRNVGRCKHGLKELGCLKVPLMLELRAVKVTNRTTEGETRSGQLGPITDELVQKVCIDVEVNIDRVVDPDIIHDGFLGKSVEAMNLIVETIDSILEPLETIFKVTLYTCLAGFVVMFILDLLETYNCDVAPVLSTLSGDGFDVAVAKAGMCSNPEVGYKGDQKTACKDCQQATQRNKDWTYGINWICDRVYCPSAPSAKKYVKDQAKSTPIKDPNKKSDGTKKEEDTGGSAAGALGGMIGAVAGSKSGGSKTNPFNFAKGSDCAAPGTKINTNYEGLKELYENYKKHKDDETTEDTPFRPDNPNCNNLHPATGECCGYEYMEKYDSACIFMDELKESKCAQAQIEGREDDDCSALAKAFNAAAGLCEADGKSPGQLVPTDLVFIEKQAEAQDTTFYLFVQTADGDTPEERRSQRKVYGGYARSKKLVASDSKTTSTSDLVSVTQQTGITKTYDFSSFFQRERSVVVNDCRTFHTKLPKSKLKPREAGNSLQILAERACKKAANTFPEGKEYIVDPTSGFLRSAQCGCVAGVNSYLKLYRNVVAAVRDCFNTILVTGDGSEGQCQAVLSVYICDLIYELISCVVKYTDFGTKEELRGPFGSLKGVMKSITSAGTNTQTRINNRYGDTSMFKTMFGEKKLVHAICLFAFTGTWSLDLSALLESGIPPVPIDSTALVYPAERRFVSFDLTSKPQGLVTWNYHMGLGVVAGSDLTHRMYLQCSADYSCDPLDGYPDGKCDCLKSGQKRVPVALKQGSIKANERYTEDIYTNIGPSGSGNAGVRYDKVIYEYQYRDNNGKTQLKTAVQKIGLRGGEAPTFCQFDILSSNYRCTLDIGNERYARFSGDPSPVYTSKGDAFSQFKLDDPVKFAIPIIQRVDESCNSPPCKDTKYLIYRLRHGAKTLSFGKQLLTNDPHIQDPRIKGTGTSKYNPKPIDRSEMLSFNGEKVVTLTPIIQLTKDHFKTSEGVTKFDWEPNLGLVNVVGTLKESRLLVINDKRKLQVYNAKGITDIRADVSKLSPLKTVEQIKFTKSGKSNTFSLDDLTISLSDEVIKKLPTAKDTSKSAPKKIPEKTMRILISPQEGKSLCQLHDEKTKKPLNLYADFEIRDASEAGRGIYQASNVVGVDSEGVRQKKTTSFNVICSKEYEETAATKKASRTPCPVGALLVGSCYCGSKTEISEMIRLLAQPNCGGKDQGNVCTEDETCVRIAGCEHNAFTDEKCHCYDTDEKTLKAGYGINKQPENCGLKDKGNYCTSSGECQHKIIKKLTFDFTDKDGKPVLLADKKTQRSITFTENEEITLPKGQYGNLTLYPETKNAVDDTLGYDGDLKELIAKLEGKSKDGSLDNDKWVLDTAKFDKDKLSTTIELKYKYNEEDQFTVKQKLDITVK